MRTVTQPAQGLISFELTQEQTLRLAASRASDIDSASDYMPAEFHGQHINLYNLFVEKLSAQQKIE